MVLDEDDTMFELGAEAFLSEMPWLVNYCASIEAVSPKFWL